MNDDLISRQAAIDLAEEVETKRLKGEIDLTYPPMVKGLRQLPSARPEQRWIPCCEKLPKDSEYVLITIRRLKHIYNKRPFISVGYVGWNGTAWWCAHDGWCDLKNIEVIAWMPLPEPYQAESEEEK